MTCIGNRVCPGNRLCFQGGPWCATLLPVYAKTIDVRTRACLYSRACLQGWSLLQGRSLCQAIPTRLVLLCFAACRLGQRARRQQAVREFGAGANHLPPRPMNDRHLPPPPAYPPSGGLLPLLYPIRLRSQSSPKARATNAPAGNLHCRPGVYLISKISCSAPAREGWIHSVRTISLNTACQLEELLAGSR